MNKKLEMSFRPTFSQHGVSSVPDAVKDLQHRFEHLLAQNNPSKHTAHYSMLIPHNPGVIEGFDVRSGR